VVVEKSDCCGDVVAVEAAEGENLYLGEDALA
jgi:hypothetical protein